MELLLFMKLNLIKAKINCPDARSNGARVLIMFWFRHEMPKVWENVA